MRNLGEVTWRAGLFPNLYLLSTSCKTETAESTWHSDEGHAVTREQLSAVSSLLLSYQSRALNKSSGNLRHPVPHMWTPTLWDQASPAAQSLSNRQHDVLLPLRDGFCRLHWDRGSAVALSDTLLAPKAHFCAV